MSQKPSNRATIKEVAALAGVSTQTVSRVINKRPDVSSETRQRVQKVIEELSFRPSALARSLISQRSHTLGVVTAGLRYIGPSRTLSGITSAAEESGYALLLKELPTFDSSDIEPIFQALFSRHVDGIIWAVPEIGDNRKWIANPPAELHVPLVYLAMAPRPGLLIACVDNYLGGRMAMEHLLAQGYRKIGHVSGPLDWWEARQRMKAWRDVLDEAGLDASDAHWVEGNWSPSSGAIAIEKLFNQYPDMDAVFVANDQMAISAMQFFRERGINIPEQIGIAGFDNLAESAYFSPALTTIEQDQHNVAKTAVAEIVRVIESGWQGLDDVHHMPIVLPPKLIARQSSCRFRGGDV
jgi:LacI family transcriptional regulator